MCTRITRIKARKPASKPRPLGQRGKKLFEEVQPCSEEEHQREPGLKSLQGCLGRIRGSPKKAQCITDTEQLLPAGTEMHPNTSPIPGLQAKQTQLLSLQNSSGCFQSSSTVPILPTTSPLFWQLVSMLYSMMSHQWKNWNVMTKDLDFPTPPASLLPKSNQGGEITGQT